MKKTTQFIFLVYLFLLSWLILFKFAFSLKTIPSFRGFNLIPFFASAQVNGHISLKEIILNVLIFVPLGVYVQLYFPKHSFTKKVMICLFVSTLFEMLQFVFALGASDITDLCSNTLGGCIGIWIALLFKRHFHQRAENIINGIGLLIEACAFVLIAMLYLANH